MNDRNGTKQFKKSNWQKGLQFKASIIAKMRVVREKGYAVEVCTPCALKLHIFDKYVSKNKIIVDDRCIILDENPGCMSTFSVQ